MTRTAFTPTASADSRLTVSRLRLPALIACLLVLTLGGCSAAPSISAQLQQELDAAPAAQTLDDLPSFEEASSAFVTVAGNEPSFTDAELDRAQSAARSDAGYEDYSPLDMLGRCGTAEACLGPETMPTDKRGSISAVHPSGWQSVRYDFVDGESLYNRCHLIAFSLAGENANERNLITGTRYLNVEGMLPFENEMADYVRATGNRVLLRATPVFVGDELVARGVHLEAQSVEDNGAGVSFSVFCYNVQPGIDIDYATGESWRAAQPVAEASDESGNTAEDAAPSVDANAPASPEPAGSGSTQMTYISTPTPTCFTYPAAARSIGCPSTTSRSSPARARRLPPRDSALAATAIPSPRRRPTRQVG